MDMTRTLARWRVPLGFIAAIAVMWAAAPDWMSLAGGGLVASGGEALRIWAAGHLNKSREVTTSGPYRWTAHPLYFGSAIMGVGLAIASRSFIVTAIIGVYLAVTLTAAIRSEEAFLRERFGDRYETYREQGGGEAANRAFSWAQARANREYRAVAGLGLAVLLLALKATYNGVFWRTGAGR